MNLHWTYNTCKNEDPLRQGDIIERTNPLLELFEEVHPHFCNPKYLAFLVITQSCDLVLRKDKCEARYINLAVIRSLEEMLDTFLEKYCNKAIDGVYLSESKLDAKKLLWRIFNQNEQNLGIFYLHPHEEVKLAVPSVALLRVSVSFRSQHYDVIRKARCGCLDAEFRNKLGWLVGNIFSRIGTPDWSDHEGGKKQLENLVKQMLNDEINPNAPLWIKKTWKDAAEQKGVNLKTIPRDKIVPTLTRYKPEEPIEEAIKHIITTIEEVMPHTSQENIKKIKNRLNNNTLLRATFRRAAQEYGQ